MSEGLKVIGLRVENIKRVQVVDLHPTEPVVKISGDNGAGKSSLLDAIMYAIEGKRVIPDDPIREGEDRAEIRLELGEFTVIRSFKRKPEGGFNSVVKVMATESGATYSNGQQVLDGFLSKLTFDPLRFSQMTSKEQHELLKQMVDLGIDLGEWQLEHDRLFDLRRDQKKEVKLLEGNLTSAPQHPDAPAEEISVSRLSGELNLALQATETVKDIEREFESASDDMVRLNGNIVIAKGEVERLEKELSVALGHLVELKNTIPRHKDLIAETKKKLESAKANVPDTVAIQNQINGAETTNKLVRDNKSRGIMVSNLKIARETLAVTETALSCHKQIKDDAIKAAKYPVEGLEFTDDGLLFNGFPLEQASGAEQVIISTRIGMALNPKLRVLIIRNASLMGPKQMDILGAISELNDYQIWCEIVDITGEIGFYLEDGELVLAESTPKDPKADGEFDPVKLGQGAEVHTSSTEVLSPEGVEEAKTDKTEIKENGIDLTLDDGEDFVYGK